MDPPGLIGLAWFDSLVGLRVHEFHRFRPWFGPGTVVGFHDTGPHKELRPDVDRLVAEGFLSVVHLSTPRGVAFAQVLDGHASVRRLGWGLGG